SFGRCFFDRRFGCGSGLCGRGATLNLYVVDLHRSKRAIVAGIAAGAGNLLHERDAGVVALSEDGVAAIEMRHRDFGDKELRAVRVRPRGGQGQASRASEGEGGGEVILEVMLGTT